MARRVVVHQLADLTDTRTLGKFSGEVSVGSDVALLGVQKHNKQLTLVTAENERPVGRVTLQWWAIPHLESIPPGFTPLGVVSMDFFTWVVFTRIT